MLPSVAQELPSQKRRDNSTDEIKAKRTRVILEDQNKVCLKIDLLAQIFSMRVSKNSWHRWKDDEGVIESVIDLCDAPFRTDQQKNSILQRVFSADIYNCLARKLIEKNIVTKEHWLYKLDTFLALYSLPKNAILNAEALLCAGASPHVTMRKYQRQPDDLYVYGVCALTAEENTEGLKLLLRAGAHADMVDYHTNPLVTALFNAVLQPSAVINILLYYGANPSLGLFCRWVDRYPLMTPITVSATLSKQYPESQELRKLHNLCAFGHARRVHRLACYLKRFNDIPLEINYICAEYVYGKLSPDDWRAAQTYSAYDYLKIKPV